MRLATNVFLAVLAVAGCGGAKASAVPNSERPLDQAAVEVLAREACPRLLTQTFPLADPSDHMTTGRLWVRQCSAHVVGRDVAVELGVLGWQWLGAGSWGFSVREYVYFRAVVRATLRASVEVASGNPSLRVWSDASTDVDVGALGRVAAHAEGPGARLLGVTLGIVGRGPNALATTALRHGVADRIKTQAKSGFDLALADPPDAARVFLSETQRLFPGGALISGSFPPNVPTTLRFDVRTRGSVLARPMCVDDVLPFVDSVIENAPKAQPAAPRDVLALRERGEVAIEPQPCTWMLVTGSSADADGVVAFELLRGTPTHEPGERRWVETTLLAYNVELPKTSKTRLFGFRVNSGESAASFGGRPLTRDSSPAVRLVAPPVEVKNGAPLVIQVFAWTPRPASFWNPEPGYTEALIGHATIEVKPRRKHEEHRATIEQGDARSGWVEVALDTTEVE